MKIVVALDSFKGGLTAANACRAVEQGLREANPSVNVTRKPMADGGEGTAAALLAAWPNGKWIPASVSGPLPGRNVDAAFAWFPDDRTAVIEMAAASGLPLLDETERNPLITTTFGTGQLIAAAGQQGAQRIWLTLGGSATVDGGIGAAAALGWSFLNTEGRPVPPGGGNLRAIARIVPPADAPRPPRITALYDVKNPLCGPTGAAAVFGPQKGATPDQAKLLEAGLSHLAERIRKDLGRTVADLPGAGAAGGLGAGAVAFLNADLALGISAVVEAVELEKALQGADGCITGEGSFDAPSLQGKVISGVTELALRKDVPVTVFAGRVQVDPDIYRKHGIRDAVAIHAPDLPIKEVFRREKELLRTAAASWMKRYLSGAS